MNKTVFFINSLLTVKSRKQDDAGKRQFEAYAEINRSNYEIEMGFNGNNGFGSINYV
ncbi:hypothetical protein QLX67_05185 [Balneolaceae bacterium ANBcel3]|nr:hypothetical protein [Balneolaceae bacterium ANBcel3]